MKLLVLGTAGYHPSERRQTTCLMLPEAGIVLDAGTGFFRVRKYLQTPTLDILLTHAHLDHVVGLTYLLTATWEKGIERVTIRGEASKLAAIRTHLLAEELFPVPLPCQWQALEPGELSIGDIRVTHFPLPHLGGSVGYRLDWPGRSLAYVTDTTAAPDAAYVESIRGADLLVHECNFRDGFEAWAAETGHSCTSAVAHVAQAAGVQRLVLMHFHPLDESDDPIGLEAARAIFPATDLGCDGMEIEI
ncbi:MAG TPA: MBL fold metallo-hydrolase [Pirellulaceae bacterium]|nr:MBL fold metallo-hydrolase [Pirellulaceae bacterium]